jgi:hypothetical protein
VSGKWNVPEPRTRGRKDTFAAERVGPIRELLRKARTENPQAHPRDLIDIVYPMRPRGATVSEIMYLAETEFAVPAALIMAVVAVLGVTRPAWANSEQPKRAFDQSRSLLSFLATRLTHLRLLPAQVDCIRMLEPCADAARDSYCVAGSKCVSASRSPSNRHSGARRCIRRR